MKEIKTITQSMINSMVDKTPVLCSYVFGPFCYEETGEPINSNNYSCKYCGGKEHYTPLMDPKLSDKKAWLCANPLCVVNKAKKSSGAVPVLPNIRKPQGWALFCEINGIGDVYHDVVFENINQSPSKIEFLHKFVTNPRGIILMQGMPGTGKTYACLGVCEKFTRTKTSCLFMTQKQMVAKWSEAFKDGIPSNFNSQVLNCNLLVIDDFGTGEVSPGFMSFFMDVINSRIQWKDRGTIITTNLDAPKFTQFCGDALTDRIREGQHFKFEGPSRRHKHSL